MGLSRGRRSRVLPSAKPPKGRRFLPDTPRRPVMRIANKLKKYGKLVMFSHSLFSLPFGFIAMLWAENRMPDTMVFVWIAVALLGARNGANAFNRIADRHIDKRNRRTADRHLATGAVTVFEAYAITVFCFAAMAFAAYMLNPLCLILSPFAVAWVMLYSYTKRITWLCHYILGAACALAPVGAWLAVTGKIGLAPLVLGAVVCLYVGGFDIIYATQDIEFDRQEGLHSIPARFGLRISLIISAVSHIGAVALLVSLYFMIGLGAFYLIGVIIVSVLLCIEHYNVVPENKDKMIFAAYSVNQAVSVVLFVFCMIDFFA